MYIPPWTVEIEIVIEIERILKPISILCGAGHARDSRAWPAPTKLCCPPLHAGTIFNSDSDSDPDSDSEKNQARHRYKALGTVPDTYGDHKLEWYAFEAADKEGKASEYRYIMMLQIHQHQNGQSHFHIRYGSDGVKKLTGLGGMGNWWPTMVKPDFDVAAYIDSINPKLMVKLLP